MQVYITFLRFEIQARNDQHDTANDEHYTKKVTKEKEKFSDICSWKVLVTNENSYLDVAMES